MEREKGHSVVSFPGICDKATDSANRIRCRMPWSEREVFLDVYSI
jgi:hypothetical protein